MKLKSIQRRGGKKLSSEHRPLKTKARLAAAKPCVSGASSSATTTNTSAVVHLEPKRGFDLGRLAVMVLCGVYLSQFVYRGWIPHDQGTLAQSAERILDGQLPHRDFDAVYTGGLSFLNTASFLVLGVSMASIRTVFSLFAMAFVWTFYSIVRRVLPAVASVIVVTAAVTWSLTNYFAALPSWYNLFFAVFGTAACFRYIDSQRTRWLFLAGAFGGLSILFKVTGLYYIAAVFFFLVYDAQLRDKLNGPTTERSIPYGHLAIAATVSLVWLALVGLLVRSQLDAMLFTQLIFPSVALACVLVVNAARCGALPLGELKQLLTKTAAVVAGACLPLALFSVPFIIGGALDDLLEGVFIKPQLRLDAVTYPLPSMFLLVLEVPVVLMLVFGISKLARNDQRALLYAAIGLTSLLYLCQELLVLELVFTTLRLAPPVAAAFAAWYLLTPRSDQTPTERKQFFVALAMLSCTLLIQFPFAAPIYFCFVSVFLFLVFVFLSKAQLHPTPRTHAAFAVFSLVFGVVFLNQTTFFGDPILAREDPPVNKLELPRGGLLVSQHDKEKYEKLVSVIHAHSDEEDFILAAPDCPEVYFLAERKNPTRTLFELFDDASKSAETTQELISELDIDVVVINREPGHSPKLKSETVSVLCDEFPHKVEIDNFVVHYRDN